MLQDRIASDLKAAMLKGDKVLVSNLRGLKSAILYAEVAAGKRDIGLSEDEITAVLVRERKKRLESAELYKSVGEHTRASLEYAEVDIITTYLPTQLTDVEIKDVVEKTIKNLSATSIKDMGKVMATIKENLGARVDSSKLAQITKEKLDNK